MKHLENIGMCKDANKHLKSHDLKAADDPIRAHIHPVFTLHLWLLPEIVLHVLCVQLSKLNTAFLKYMGITRPLSTCPELGTGEHDEQHGDTWVSWPSSPFHIIKNFLSDRERQKLYNITYVKLKNITSQYKKKETDSQMHRTNQWLPVGKGKAGTR